MKGLDIDHTIRGGLAAFGDQGRINGIAVTILTISFLVSVILEWRKQLAGDRPNWAAPVQRVLVFGVLLAFYSLVARSLIDVVASLGDLQEIDPNSAKKTVFAARAEAFSKTMGDDASFSFSNLELSAAALVNSLLDIVTYLTFTLAAAAVFILKVIQKVMLSVLLTLGPVMIAFGAIPGLTSQFLSAWVLGVIEVSAWGITAKIFLAMLISSESGTTVNPDVTQNLCEHIVFNTVYAVSFLVIPAATHAILRGGAAGLGQTGMGAAKGAAVGAALGAAGSAAALAHRFEAAARENLPKVLEKAEDLAGRIAGARSHGASHGGANERAGDGGVPASPPSSTPSYDRRDGNGTGEARRAAFARNGAIRKHEREGDR